MSASLRPVVILVPILLAGAFLLALLRRPPDHAAAAEIAVLTEENFDLLAPRGKEGDAILGDFVLRNARLSAVVGDPVPRRDANASVRGVGGAVIDLTTNDSAQDLMAAFYPGGGRYLCQSTKMTGSGRVHESTPRPPPGVIQGEGVRLTCTSPPRDFKPAVTLTYSLGADDPFLTITTEMRNDGERRFPVTVEDSLIAQGPSFSRVADGDGPLFWAYDRWFGQAYGLTAEGLSARIRRNKDESIVTWLVGGEREVDLPPGSSLTVTRRLFPAANTIDLMAIARGGPRDDRWLPAIVRVTDRRDEPVAFADVKMMVGEEVRGEGRTAADGALRVLLPPERVLLTAEAHGRPARTITLEAPSPAAPVPRNPRIIPVVLDAAPRVVGRVTGTSGEPIPCKVSFTGVDGTPTPDFGPVTGDRQVGNLLYLTDGLFEQEVPPGTYEVTISHGPEFDREVRRLELADGLATVQLEAVLQRTVFTPGWVSADFHGHSTASGDTTASMAGRVLNLAAEGIEFAPCTEHNRIETYAPVIEALGLTGHLATAPGIELTSEPFPVGHQNAFPLVLRPRTQGNGAPAPNPDPVRQVRRLAGWDEGSEKLLQQNHPDIGWVYFDADEDGVPDDGFGLLPYQDAIEVYATNVLKMEPFIVHAEAGLYGPAGTRENNRVFNWLQMLNQGVRLAGVGNSDAHTNLHGSGGVRNYVRAATDEPARLEALDMVRSAKAGHIVMTNGPYLDVTAMAESGGTGTPAVPGDDLAAPGGHVRLHARVQCPNWIDIDRVQVLLNGRIAAEHSFTRYMHPKKFKSGSVKFDQSLDLTLQADTHVIVVAAHKHAMMEPVMGPEWGGQPPMAISNPIFVDVDGNGFKANGDTLGHPLPVKLSGRPQPVPPSR